MWGRVRGIGSAVLGSLRTGKGAGPRERPHNLFEAAAAYVSACAEDDQDRIEEVTGWVSPEALSFGVNELACRAVVALARERDESPGAVARALLGLPAA
ncbi:hypothetical protein [Streptomyces capillispiralis]|uniref:Uncharacterized protein n=1 Tax=Streptomyces capillispiralis TaxID=68182 RepID=A0A561TPL0_9ACTN|nr:hypothetical protein [Streptomyces capillispiralis]TWF89056.1 hypothetical protein FHX78_116098 [Streptomyces capillispiralis]GHH93326.1 hypothetical protein GCM10017779_37830 [Streptomyces capillispiralis]